MLAVIPVREGSLPAGGAEVAAECDGQALLIGEGTARAAAELAGICSKVRVAEVGAFQPGAWSHTLAPWLTDHPQVVLPGSPDGRDLAPRLAFELRRELHAGAIAVTPERIIVARHGGLFIAEVRPHGPFVATLQPGVRGVEHHLGAAAPEVVPIELSSTNTGAGEAPKAARGDDAVVLEVLPPDVTTMDLAEAPRIVGAGAGIDSPERLAQLAAVAAALGAAMGTTRVLTDRGWVSHARQIGTTGVVVNPRLYLAFAISGAVQHTSGLGQPDHIISVNTDPHCPMMQLADLAVVADANAVVVELARRLGVEGAAP